MNAVYRALLKLYPAEFQAMFAEEMTEVFDEACKAQDGNPHSSSLPFAIAQYVGLVKGAFQEQMARCASRDLYLQRRRVWYPTNSSEDEADLRRNIAHLVQSMQFAIAQHDFRQARFYADEERTARVHLEHLLHRRTGFKAAEDGTRETLQ